MVTTEPSRPAPPAVHDGAGKGGEPGWEGGLGDAAAPGMPPAVLAAWVLAVAVAMLFMGFTATYLARQAGSDWQGHASPPILFFNTAVLLMSSAALEWGRRSWRAGPPSRASRGIQAAAALGIVFMAGQAVAWVQLAAEGLGITGDAHISFFYVLTGMHTLHLIAGIAWLGAAWARVGRAMRRRHDGEGGTTGEVAAALCSSAIFWHFLAGLWVYLWILLFWV